MSLDREDAAIAGDLRATLEKAGAPMTTEAASLDTLKANSLLARDILETMGEWKGAIYNFQSMHGGARGTRGGK